MARKTIVVEDIRGMVNTANASPMPLAELEGINSLLGSILHNTGNYKGFRYLDMEADEIRRFYF